MAIEKISYTVSALGLEPSTKQPCGVQGDHNIYQLVFNIDSVLWDALQNEALNKGTVYYRFDVYNGEGAKASTQPQPLEGKVINYNVEEWLTRFGGVGKVVMVITLSEDAVTHLELYSFPAVLQFRNRPTGSEPKSGEHQSITTLAEATIKAAQEAEAARFEAVAARDEAADIKDAIENGVILQLDGKHNEDKTDYFIISNAVTEGGSNAVSGSAVYKALREIENKLNSAVAGIKAAAVLEAHPVGSLYWSSDSTNPEALFGGKWQRITDKFIFAAGDVAENGSVGGAATVTLTEKNIAAHKHKGLFYAVNDKPISMKWANGTTEGYGYSWEQTTVYGHTSTITGVNLEEGETPTAINIMPPYVAYYCWIRTE